MTPTLLDLAAPVSPEALAAFERELGTPLPDDYRTHLLRANGGRPEPAYFDVTWPAHADPAVTEDDSGGVHYFFALGGPVPASELTRNFSTYRGLIPDDTIAIATDWGGNPVLLGIRGPNRGRVFFHLWREGREDQAGPVDVWDNVGEVAPTFGQFMAELRDDS